MWLGGPALVGCVVAADYRVALSGAPTAEAIAVAARSLLEARTLPRERAKGDGIVRYDLRPLLADVVVLVGPPVTIRIRTRFHPELGTGRPEEVVLALGDQVGAELAVDTIVRERLVLAGATDRRDASRT